MTGTANVYPLHKPQAPSNRAAAHVTLLADSLPMPDRHSLARLSTLFRYRSESSNADIRVLAAA